MTANELDLTARALVAEGKGILAADESTGTMTKRLEALDIPSTEHSRRAYRELLFTAPQASKFLSGMILYDETIRQDASDGTPIPDALAKLGIIPGIKVDTGAKPLAGAPQEKVTEGLDGLRDRLEEYRELGARFTKWRAVIAIGEGSPSQYCIDVNAHALARYAALCQEAGLVPIVEPEVLMDGDHSLERCQEVTAATLRAVFGELARQRVELERMLLKPNMVLPGQDASTPAMVEDVARATVRCLRQSVPAAVAGIVFLSGGQGDLLATAHLNAINTIGTQPWPLSFSYGRALQDPALRAWQGDDANLGEAKGALSHRAQLNSAACRGRYSEQMERELVV